MSAPENLEAAEDPAATPFARVAGVFGSPGPTFASIARRPGWVLPIVIATLLSIAATAAVLPRIDFDTAVRERLAARGVTMPEERVERIVDAQKKFSGLGYVWALLANLLITLGLAAVLWVSFKAFGWDVAFRQSFGITSHALLPYIGTSMLLILFVTRLDLVNPADLGDLTHSNLGFLVDRHEHAALHSLAASIDVFTFWVLGLLVIGFAIAARVPKKKAAILILSLWGLFVLGKVGFAALFR